MHLTYVRRYVGLSLLMSLLVLIFTWSVAYIDPFESGEPRLNWLILFLGGVLGVFFSQNSALLVFGNDKVENHDRFVYLMIVSAIPLVVLATVFTIIISSLSSHMTNVIWGGYGAMLMVYLLNSKLISLAQSKNWSRTPVD